MKELLKKKSAMRKIVVIGVSDKLKYLTSVPLAVWAWRQLGWEVAILQTGLLTKQVSATFDVTDDLSMAYDGIHWAPLTAENISADSLSQICRLYVAELIKDEAAFIMTSDADMIPLKDFWSDSIEFDKINIWGHDLTGYTHYPMCYIGMTRSRWVETMCLTGNFHADIARDLKDVEITWFTDQDLIQRKINATQFPVKHRSRGVYKATGYAINRVDRSSWSLQHNELWDCHNFHIDTLSTDEGAANFARVIRMVNRVWPNEDFTWYINYMRKVCK